MVNLIVYGDREYTNASYIKAFLAEFKYTNKRVTALAQARGPGQALRRNWYDLPAPWNAVPVSYGVPNPTVTAAAQCIKPDCLNIALCFGTDSVADRVRAYFQANKVMCIQVPLDLNLTWHGQAPRNIEFAAEPEDEFEPHNMCDCWRCLRARGEDE